MNRAPFFNCARHIRRRQMLALIAATTIGTLSLVFSAPGLAMASGAPGTITEYPVLTASSDPLYITAGADGNLWFTEWAANKIGKITPSGTVTEYTLPTTAGEPSQITAGPDGNLWFTESGGVGKITPSGTVTEYTLPTAGSSPEGITAGPDGNLWFTEAGTDKIGKITPSGMITEYPVLTVNSEPWGITAGPDGNLWFTESAADTIGKITPSGNVTEYPVHAVPTVNSEPWDITAGPDGNLWFTDIEGGEIGKITPSGIVAEYPVPAVGSLPYGITAGPDGNIWFTEEEGNIGTFDLTTDKFTEYPVPTAGSAPDGITAGPDGNIWFTEDYGGVGVLQLATGQQSTIVVNVSGTQAYGSSSPTFAYTTTPSALPNGLTISGTLSCATVNGGVPISPTMAIGASYTVDGSSCSGLTFSGATGYGLSIVGVADGFSVNEGSQTVSFTALASGTVGALASLSATGGASGNPVVFSVDASSGAGVCNLSGPNGSTVTYTARGNCVIDANQAGNADYLVAGEVQQTIAVTAPQTITFRRLANKSLAQSPLTVAAVGGASGNPVTFTTTTPTVCMSGGANGATITLVGTGTCIVQANQAGNATYSAAPTVSQNFTVSKAPQTITFRRLANKSLAQSPLTVAAVGGASGNPVTFTTTTPTVCMSGGANGATITFVGTGTCVVQANQAGNATYSAARTVSRHFRIRP